jgi:hypothetical protein
MTVHFIIVAATARPELMLVPAQATFQSKC